MSDPPQSPPQAVPERWKWRRKGLILFVLAAGTIALYARVGTFDFIGYDDTNYVVNNQSLKQGISRRSIVWAFTTGDQSNWHPLTWLSYLADVQLFGVRAGPMHVENALLHTANTCLLFLLLELLTNRPWPSAWVAAMFAWHPLHVESVAWIAERKDVLCGFFSILCLIAYVQYGRAPSIRRMFLVGFMLCVALMAKPMAVTLPLLMLMLDFWPLHRVQIMTRKLLVEKLPLFALVMASCVITLIAQSSGQSVASLQGIPLSMRLANAMVACATYLRMTIAPYGLAIFYPHPGMLPAGGIPAVALAISAIIVVGVTILAIRFTRPMPWLLVGWLWYLVSLLPVIGIIQVGDQAMADRYSYFPLIGVFIAIAWMGVWLMDKLPQPGRLAATSTAVACALAYGLIASRQIGYWRDTETIMRHAIDVVPNSYIAHAILGQTLEERGDIADASSEYARALDIQPNNMIALTGMVSTCADQGKMDEAIQYAQRAVAVYPNVAGLYNNLAAILDRQHRTDDAINALRTAVSLDQNSVPALHNLAMLLAGRGDMQGAIVNWRKAISLSPDYVDAICGLGEVLVRTGQSREGFDRLRYAADLAERQGNTGKAKEIRQRIQFYEQHVPLGGGR